MENQNRGWLVTLCSVGINLCMGMLYAWSVFSATLVKPVEQGGLGLTKTEAALPFSVAICCMAFFTIPGGRAYDRWGPRICCTIGGILFGCGLILSSFVSSPLALAITFGAFIGIGIGFAYGAVTPASVKWFPPQKRGLITGIVVAGVGLAAVYAAPLTQYFISHYGVRKAFWIEGLSLLAIILFLAQFVSNPPANYTPAEAPAPASGGPVTSSRREYSPAEMMATPQFWLMWLMYGFGGLAGLMVIGQMAIIARVQVGIEYGFIFVSLMAIFNASGRVIGGFLSDKLGRTKTLILMFAIQAVNMLFFSSYTTASLLTIGIIAGGIAYGSLFALFPPITYDYFGMKNAGFNYGCLFTAWGLAGVAGPVMAGRIVDITKSFNLAYMICAGVLVLAIIFGLLLRAPKSEAIPQSANLGK